MFESLDVCCWELVVSINPKSSEFVVGCWRLVVDLPFVPNSMNPSRFVGTTMSFFGIRTTPRFWSSRTSIILFFFLKSIYRVRELGI